MICLLCSCLSSGKWRSLRVCPLLAIKLWVPSAVHWRLECSSRREHTGTTCQLVDVLLKLRYWAKVLEHPTFSSYLLQFIQVDEMVQSLKWYKGKWWSTRSWKKGEVIQNWKIMPLFQNYTKRPFSGNTKWVNNFKLFSSKGGWWSLEQKQANKPSFETNYFPAEKKKKSILCWFSHMGN